jgi:hypothetical protein
MNKRYATISGTCEAWVRKEQGEYGFTNFIRCTQSVGLTSLLDAAGITHHACARFGHRDQLVRRFGETILPEEPDAIDEAKWYAEVTA